MIKNLLIIFVVALAFASCAKEKRMDEKQLENMLFEMHFADGVMQAMPNNITDSTRHYQLIFDKYKITRNDFEKTIRLYAQDQDAINRIYDNVRIRFELMQKELNGSNIADFNNIKQKLLAPIDSIFKPLENFIDSTKSFDDFLKWYKNIPEQIRLDSIKEANAQTDNSTTKNEAATTNAAKEKEDLRKKQEEVSNKILMQHEVGTPINPKQVRRAPMQAEQKNVQELKESDK